MAKSRKKRLSASFFARDTRTVACDLLGKFLVRRLPSGEEISAKITEVEVYDGFRDKGSHAARGETARNAPMYAGAGRWYVYFAYGMHWMLNIVTREAGYPAAILLRAVEGVQGPARLTKRFGIDSRFTNTPATKDTGLWLEDRGVAVDAKDIRKGPRIGIAYAGKYWAGRRLRFWLPAAATGKE